MSRYFYLVCCLLLIGLYGWVEATGRTVGTSRRQQLPADARQAPGGYRAFHFWHGGFRGGK